MVSGDLFNKKNLFEKNLKNRNINKTTLLLTNPKESNNVFKVIVDDNLNYTHQRQEYHDEDTTINCKVINN